MTTDDVVTDVTTVNFAAMVATLRPRRPDGPPPGVLDRAMVAERSGIAPNSLTKYVHRGQAPAPDGYVGDAPWWYESRIEQWITERPGVGAPGRPRAKRKGVGLDPE